MLTREVLGSATCSEAERGRPLGSTQVCEIECRCIENSFDSGPRRSQLRLRPLVSTRLQLGIFEQHEFVSAALAFLLPLRSESNALTMWLVH